MESSHNLKNNLPLPRFVEICYMVEVHDNTMK
jgi:hypothetical protein